VPVVRVGPDRVRRYRLWLKGHDIAPTTVWHILSDARCFLRWCEETGLVSRTPFPRRVMPRLQERPPDRLSETDIARILAMRDPYGFVIRLALGTGLRWGELTRAEAAHVEGDWLVVRQTKSGKVRRVPLPAELLREIRSRVGRLVGFSELSPGSFAAAIKRESGLARFPVHQTRHTFACRWVEQGGNLAALQQILGHASIVTTQRYARLSDDAVRREAERLATTSQRGLR
jgi:integrase